MPSSLSPAILSKEVDLTFRNQSVAGINGAFAGAFRWGPVEEPILISEGEEKLVSTFSTPDDETYVSFLSAADYLKYSNALYVTRVTGPAALNALPATESDGTTPTTAILIKNEDHLETISMSGVPFLARCPGVLGNSIKVSVANSDGFSTWDYVGNFTYAPTGTQFNMVVVDADGAITGTANTVMETYELLDLSSTAKKFDGSAAYFKDVLNQGSSYVFVPDASAVSYTDGVYEVTFQSGADDNVYANVDFDAGYAFYENPESLKCKFIFLGDAPAATVGTVVDYAEVREDAMAYFSPPLAAVLNNKNSEVADIVEYREVTTNKNSSYGVMDDNWKMVRDRYNDKNRWIPCNASVAGLHAQTHIKQDPWYSPAGFNRGVLKNVVKLAWNATKAQRDSLYKTSVNSIVSFPGRGTVLYGDKTQLALPSAFDRINVRSLFNHMKEDIVYSAQANLFEFNDELTRSLFRNKNNAYLEDILSRRGIYDFRVVCDESNNTQQVIDSNEFVGSIFVKPSKSINVIRLNFVATPTGVDFEEIEIFGTI